MSLHLSRPLRRAGVVAAALTALVLAGAGTASAHVTVSSPDAAAGGYGEFTFRVPNESDSASTVDLRIQLPTDHPLASVSAQPVPGWTLTTTTGNLPQPVKTDDGEVTSAVTVVEYRADAGGGIAPGQFQEFSLSGGPVPDVKSLTFNVVQTYSDGTQTAWIEPTVAGQAEPEHPAPTLQLTAAKTSGSSAAAAPAAASDNGGSNGTAVAALVVGVLGLLAGLAGLALGLTARRRTVER